MPVAIGFGSPPDRRRIAAQLYLRAKLRAVGRLPKPIPPLRASQRSSFEVLLAACRQPRQIAPLNRRSKLALRSWRRYFLTWLTRYSSTPRLLDRTAT